MLNVLVPLDGSSLAETAIPDACDLAGKRGGIVLLHVIRSPNLDRGTDGFRSKSAVEDSNAYLASRAKPLREQGFTVRVRTLVRHDVSAAIDETAITDQVDLVACATHGRGPGGRLIHGSVTWKAVANSPVPVFLRHVEEGPMNSSQPSKPYRIMVPLDGSAYAEKAILLAGWLSMRWNAPIALVRVVEYPYSPAVYGLTLGSVDFTEELTEAKKYLDGIAMDLPSEVETHAWAGQTVPDLVAFAKENSITHVVMASHGRTAMSRVILGSVADSLIHQLHCPIIVIPALAPGRVENHTLKPLSKASALTTNTGAPVSLVGSH
jgi:nucleotide-binding universal stress UspA family protein